MEISRIKNKISLRPLLAMFNSLLDILFQEKCLGCNKKGLILCRFCIPFIRRAERETGKDIYAVYDYRDPVIKRAIWKLKYYKSKHLAIVLGTLLYENMLEDLADMSLFTQGKPILVIPVPLSHKRMRERGYNQAQSIAHNFCLRGAPGELELGDNILIKTRDTPPQARISNRVHRMRNIRNAFEVTHNARVNGRTIIVIDDVTTTGATMHELIHILEKSGAKKVVGFAVAH